MVRIPLATPVEDSCFHATAFLHFGQAPGNLSFLAREDGDFDPVRPLYVPEGY